jgi:thiamine pyrophosphate-dependent acetolactate synthase large subunit-like protein
VLPLQALWTQAREQLQVLTIICANNTYAILKVNSSSTALNQCCRTFNKRSMLLW